MLVDINMPVMSGPELLRALAGTGYAGAIVLASGADPETLAVAESMAGMQGINVIGVVAKPVTPPALTEVLAKLD